MQRSLAVVFLMIAVLAAVPHGRVLAGSRPDLSPADRVAEVDVAVGPATPAGAAPALPPDTTTAPDSIGESSDSNTIARIALIGLLVAVVAAGVLVVRNRRDTDV